MARTPHPWYRREKGRWYVTIDGKQVALPVTDPTDQATAWSEVRRLIQESVREAIQPTAKCRAGCVRELVVVFLEAKRGDVATRTLRGYGLNLSWLTKHWGLVSVATIPVSEIRTKAAAETWGDTHRANVLWGVNAFLRWCGRTESIPLPPRESRGGDAVIPEDIHRRILNETRGDFRSLCRFLWLTGCRPGEAAGLTVEVVDWDAGTVRLKKHKTRHKGKTRVLYLCKEAVDVLADQRAKHGEGHLFRGLRGRPFGLGALVMRFERVSEKVGRRVTSYMYRHSWASRALAAGVPDAQVAAMLGHCSTAMVHRHYSHIGEDARLLRAIAEKLAG